jgi:hypothetical protein
MTQALYAHMNNKTIKKSYCEAEIPEVTDEERLVSEVGGNPRDCVILETK